MKKLLLLILSVNAGFLSELSASESRSKSNNARIFIELPQNSNSKIKKQIFHLEGYKTLECPLKQELNKDHVDYIGVLAHVESSKFLASKKKINVSTQEPLMLSASYSSIYNSDKSEICYFQSHSFWPKSDTTYLVKFNANCTVSGFEIQSDGQTKPIKLNNLVDSCFKN